MSARVSHSLVTRADGKQINVVRKTGQLFVCSDACCCGQVDSGNPPVPLQQLQTQWEQRKLRNKVHLTTGGCLGPCDLANVAMLLFDGRTTWLHSFHTAEQVTALYDYIEPSCKPGHSWPHRLRCGRTSSTPSIGTRHPIGRPWRRARSATR